MNTERNPVTTIETAQCYQCGEFGEVGLTAEELVGYEHWLHGTDVYIQDCIPTLPKELREQIITGTHPKCWQDMFTYSEDLDEDEENDAENIAFILENFGATETQVQPPSVSQEYPQMSFFFGEEETAIVNNAEFQSQKLRWLIQQVDIMQKVMQETLTEISKWKEGK